MWRLRTYREYVTINICYTTYITFIRGVVVWFRYKLRPSEVKKNDAGRAPTAVRPSISAQ